MKRGYKIFIAFVLLFGLSAYCQTVTNTPGEVGFKLSLEGENFSRAVSLFLLMTVLSLAPAFVMMMTSFTRLVIVISFMKQAMGTQQAPSRQMVAALALFLTFFIMQPIWQEVYAKSVQPYSEKKITDTEAMEEAARPIRRFMLKQTREETLVTFMELGALEPVETIDEIPLRVVVPSFMISELQTAFQMGFLIYLPFLVIDAVVATFLMSMGMMMLPPMMVSMPFKLLLFVMVDGWNLVIKALVMSFAV